MFTFTVIQRTTHKVNMLSNTTHGANMNEKFYPEPTTLNPKPIIHRRPTKKDTIRALEQAKLMKEMGCSISFKYKDHLSQEAMEHSNAAERQLKALEAKKRRLEVEAETMALLSDDVLSNL